MCGRFGVLIQFLYLIQAQGQVCDDGMMSEASLAPGTRTKQFDL